MRTERTEALFDAVPGAVVLVEFVEGEPIVREFNDTFSEQFGYAVDSMRGEPLNEHIVPESEAHQQVAAEIDAAAAAGETVEREVTRKTAAGPRSFLFRAAPFEEDDAVKSVGIYVAMTDQHRERQRYEAMLEHSSDIITVLDADGTIRYESPAVEGVLGYEQGALVGETAFEYVHPDDRERVVAEFEQGLTNPEAKPEVEYRFRAADGSWRWLESVGSNHVDYPPIDGYVVNTRDITQRKERERQLEWYRAYVEYQRKQRELSELQVELNVLEAEHAEHELADNHRYGRLRERAADLQTEIDELADELSDIEATCDEVPESEDLNF